MDPEKQPVPDQPTQMPQPHPVPPPVAQQQPPPPTAAGYPGTPPAYDEVPLGNTTAYPPTGYPTGYPAQQPNVTYVNGAGQPVIMVSNACIEEEYARRRRIRMISLSLFIFFFFFTFIACSWIWWW